MKPILGNLLIISIPLGVGGLVNLNTK